MAYIGYGYESILYIVLVLGLCHLVLDVLPAWYKRTRNLLAAVPARIVGGIVIIIISFFLL